MNLYRDIGTTDTNITLLLPTTLTVPGVVTIESEQIHVQSFDGQTLIGCTRAFNSTSAATHAAGTAVTSTSTDNPSGQFDLTGTAPVTVTGGTKVLSVGTAALSMHVADASHDGYMASADFNKFKSWLGILSADPGTPTEGQVWYNSTTHLLKFYDGSAIKVVATV